MKKYILIGTTLLLFSRQPKSGITFCEGISPDGKEVNCGSVFSEGDITILIKSENSFATDKININIFEKIKPVKKMLESFTVNVKSDTKTTNTNLSLYNEGIYEIEVTGKDNTIIANGTIQIVESY